MKKIVNFHKIMNMLLNTLKNIKKTMIKIEKFNND